MSAIIPLKRQTILNVAPTLSSVGPLAVGGAEQVLTRIDEALARGGHRSLVIASEGSEVKGQLISVPQVSRDTGGGNIAVNASTVRAAREALKKAIEKAISQYHISLIHLHGKDFLDYMPETDIPIVVTLHFHLADYPAQAFKHHDAGRNVTLLCVSGSQLNAGPEDCDPLYLVPNGTEVPETSIARRKRHFAMIMGRIAPEKGIHVGMDAATVAGMPVLVMGKASPKEEDQFYMRKYVVPRLGRHCRLVGPASPATKLRALASAQCLIVSSLQPDVSSLAAMEAMACGTPVVAFANGALPELIDHGRTGFVVNTQAEMADAIRKCATLDPAQCRAEAKSRFSAKAMTDLYLAIYEEIILQTNEG